MVVILLFQKDLRRGLRQLKNRSLRARALRVSLPGEICRINNTWQQVSQGGRYYAGDQYRRGSGL